MKPKYNILYKITPASVVRYEQKPVYFSKPRLVAYYDCNSDTAIKAQRINYLVEPRPEELPLDLNADINSFVARGPSLSSLNMKYTLKYHMSSNSTANDDSGNMKTKVFTRRGTLVRIMELFYGKRNCDTLRLRVSRYNNNLYIVNEEFYESVSDLKPVHTHHSTFEKILFADSPNGMPKKDEPCNENIMLVGVHQSSFGKYDMIYSGIVQGIIENEEIKDFDNLDGLTDRRFVATKQMWKGLKNKDYKYLTIFLQSYLANIRDIYIGYKNDVGVVHEPINHIFTKDLRESCSWSPSICTGVLYEFLQNVERIMSSVNCLSTVYLFQYNFATKTFTYKIFEGQSDKSFITEEYIKYCKEHFDN